MAESGEPGARNGQRVMLTRGPNRLIGEVSSDSVTWITLRLDTGCSIVVDLEGWTWCDCNPTLIKGSASPWTCPHGNTWRLGVPADPYCWSTEVRNG